MKYAPVLIPTLCRYEHLKKLIESLMLNSWAKFTDLYVAVDYSKSEKYNKGRLKILELLHSIDITKFKSVSIIERERNYGAFGNIDDLQNSIANKYDRFISIPDDMIVSPNFLEYMNRCLEKYETYKDIVAVCGYSWPVKWYTSEGATCLKQNVTCTVWGIGYWSDKYNEARQFIESGEMLEKLPEVIREKKYLRMIDVCKKEYIEAACYKWCYGHQWLKNLSDIGLRAYLAVYNKYAIVPIISKCRNYGFDGSGEYCQDNASLDFFKSQEIDVGSSFEVVGSSVDGISENHRLLNEFDSRSESVMRKTVILIWLCENIGVWSAKFYCILGIPYDFIVRVYNKYCRK